MKLATRAKEELVMIKKTPNHTARASHSCIDALGAISGIDIGTISGEIISTDGKGRPVPSPTDINDLIERINKIEQWIDRQEQYQAEQRERS